MKLLIGIIVTMLLSSCVTTGPVEGPVVEGICGLFANITYDGEKDTKQTKEQVKQFNARRDKLCGK